MQTTHHCHRVLCFCFQNLLAFCTFCSVVSQLFFRDDAQIIMIIRLHCVYFHLFTISMVWGDLSFILFSFFLLFNHKIHLSILVSITKQFKLRISFRTIRCSRLRMNCQSNTIHSFLLSCIWCRVILGIIQDRQK